MKKADTEPDLRIRPRPSEVVSIKIPVDALSALKRVAESRDMSYEALLRFYVGQGLREDLSRLSGDHILQATAEILGQHIESREEVEAILAEIRQANTRRWYPWLTKLAATDT